LSPSETENGINSVYQKKEHPLIWGIGLFITLVLLIGASSLYVLSDTELYYPLQFTNSLQIIAAVYPDRFNPNEMIEKAQDAVLEKLDRYSGLLEPRELDRVEEEFTGSYGGIGIFVIKHERGLMIMSVRDDGPAGLGGIRTGDVILKADSTELTDLTPYQSTYLLRGPENSPLELTIARNNMTDTLTFNLIRKSLPLIHIPYAGLTDNKSLYIKITDFEAGQAYDLKAALDSLCLNNPNSVEQIILDLRGNPGGLLREAYKTANYFLDAGHLIVGIKGRSIWRNQEFSSTGNDITGNKPLAIIVDRGSASASEIVAGALKYAGRAILVGDTTFGKGLVQEYSGLDDGSGLRLTTSRYYFEGGIFLNKPGDEVIDSADGIPPDYYYPFDELKPFPTRLENSRVMRNYALGNADEIVQYAPFTVTDPVWMNDFKKYAADSGFSYSSNIAEIAELTRRLIMLSGYSRKYVNAIDRICRIASKDDSDQFDNNKDYIKRRLYQIALESKYGTIRAFREAVVPYRHDIAYAEMVLRESKKD